MGRFKLIVAFGMSLLLLDAVAAQKTVYRDSLGRRQGTSETDSRGKVTYRDLLGRKKGTAETDSRGKTLFRDSLGR